MKIRNGFVSNSSSSSFVVNRDRREEVPHPDGNGRVTSVYVPVLTSKQESDLLDYGFERYVSPWDTIEYTFEIACNEDCVMKYLIEHKIPFKATCHYGQVYYEWDGVSDNLISFRNFGEEFSMYGCPYGMTIEDYFNEPAGSYVPLSVMTDCSCENMDQCKGRNECDRDPVLFENIGGGDCAGRDI